MTASKKRRTRRAKLAEARRKKAEATQPTAPDTGVRGAEPPQVDPRPALAVTPAAVPPPSPQAVHGAILDNALIGKSIRLRWGITDKHKDAAIGVTVRNMAMTDDGRVSNGAVRNLTAMEAQNQRDVLGENHETQVNVGVVVNLGDGLSELRQQLLDHANLFGDSPSATERGGNLGNKDTGPVCPVRHEEPAGAVESGATSGPDRPDGDSGNQ